MQNQVIQFSFLLFSKSVFLACWENSSISHWKKRSFIYTHMSSQIVTSQRFSYFFRTPMLINISSDRIQISVWTMSTEIPYTDLERTFPKALVALSKEHTIKSMYVINGPGSFTMLRIWCLGINLLAQSENIQLFDLPKLDLYTHWMDQWALPPVWVLFMWQRKKVWVVEGKKESELWWDRTTTLVAASDLLEYLWDRTYRAEDILKHTCFDLLEKSHVVSNVTLQWDDIQATYTWSTISTSLSQLSTPCPILEPRYMMEPTLG